MCASRRRRLDRAETGAAAFMALLVVVNLLLFASLVTPGGSEKWESMTRELLRAV